MRPTRAIASCAVATLAMVFSVQQGEHGPLVVYKLEVPRSSVSETAVAPSPQPAVTPPVRQGVTLDVALQRAAPKPAATPRLSPLEPTILGTVTMPASRAVALQQPAVAPGPVPLAPAQTAPSSVELDPLAFSALYRGAAVEQEDSTLFNQSNGDRLTLDAVSSDLAWRRETAERLRQLPVGPRF